MSTITRSTVETLVLHPDDNICLAARDLPAGMEIQTGGCNVTLRGAVGLGHKIALKRIAAGQPIHKYGQPIGLATTTIEPGEWVHVHNLAVGDFDRDYAFCQGIPPEPTPITDRTFMAYKRADGRVGTRNFLCLISSVNCSATASKFIAERLAKEVLADFPNVDGVVALTHKGGCAMQYDGEDHRQLDRVLAGYARHPNCGGYLLIGLGCETGTIGHLLGQHKLVQLGAGASSQPPSVLHLQDLGGTAKTVDEGVRQALQLLPRINAARRQQVPASEIFLGLECGGSDGNSGVTANPALGVASDRVVAAGGIAMLSETPEIYGAEHMLTRRARTPEVGQKLVDRIQWWKEYTGKFGVTMDNNPSPGNKAGGLTTIFEKSLGAIAKGGTMALNDVCLYAEPPSTKGFVVMDTPGYDPASVTGMVAGGANVVAFTTGRGSCFGCKPVPSIKIATNTPMYERMEPDMDVNAGVILTGTPLVDVGEVIFDLVLRVAGGERTKSELAGLGDEEFCPWSIGPVL